MKNKTNISLIIIGILLLVFGIFMVFTFTNFNVGFFELTDTKSIIISLCISIIGIVLIYLGVKKKRSKLI